MRAQLPHSVQVIRRSRHDVAGATPLEEAGLLCFKPLEEIVADVKLDLPRSADENLPHEVEKDAGDRCNAYQQEAIMFDLARAQAKPHIVDRAADDQRDDDFG
jgi:hypothetical protein